MGNKEEEEEEEEGGGGGGEYWFTGLAYRPYFTRVVDLQDVWG